MPTIERPGLLTMTPSHSPTLVALAEYLYQRTNGMIGSLSQLVRGAAILAIQDGTEQITRDLLDLVPVDYAAERAHRARPQATPSSPPAARAAAAASA